MSDKPVMDSVLLGIFARDARTALAVMEKTAKNIDGASGEDLLLFTIQAHAMKSNLANIGEKDFSEQAFLLEKAGKAGDRNLIKHDISSFIERLKAITEEFELEAEIIDAEQDEDPEYLQEQLELIVAASGDYNAREADFAVANLKSMSWTKETRELLDGISEHILHSDFEKAGELAATHLKKL